MVMNANEAFLEVQHCTNYCTHVQLRLNARIGALHLRAIGSSGEVTHRELIDDTELEFESLHDGEGWYLPLVIKALRIMDDRIENPVVIDDSADYELPGFVKRHYIKNGRSFV